MKLNNILSYSIYLANPVIVLWESLSCKNQFCSVELYVCNLKLNKKMLSSLMKKITDAIGLIKIVGNK